MSDSKDPKDKPGDMADVIATLRDVWRLERRQQAAAAAKKRGTVLDAGTMADADFERWERVAIEDAVDEERRAAGAEAMKRQAELAVALRHVLPEEFGWIDPRAPKFLHERVADSKVALPAARAAADALVRGEVKRVLLVGPAGSGKTSLALLIPQIMAARWAKERHDREAARIDARPMAEVVEERLRRAHEADRDLETPGRPIAIRGASPAASEMPATPAAKALAKVSRGGRLEALWTTAHKLFQLARKPVGFREADPLDAFREAPILILDDIGGEPTQANVAPVEDVLRERHDAQRITIATTGMFDADADPADLDKFLGPLSARYGAAVVRRLAEKGRAIVIGVGLKSAQRAA